MKFWLSVVVVMDCKLYILCYITYHYYTYRKSFLLKFIFRSTEIWNLETGEGEIVNEHAVFPAGRNPILFGVDPDFCSAS